MLEPRKLELEKSSKFKKDFKICHKRGYDLSLMNEPINILRIPQPLPSKYKDHALTGNYAGHREFHLLPDWLIIYRTHGNTLYLVRTGTHSDLFDK